MLRRLRPNADGGSIRLTIAGEEVTAVEGESVAAAALAAGVLPTRRAPVSGAPRAPYCLMGVCFECLMTIDGAPNVQACMVPARDGMTVSPQLARPSLKHDR